jgi:hypothetical protein
MKKKAPKDLQKPVVEYETVDGEQKVLHVFESAAKAYRYYKSLDPPIDIWPSRISQVCNGQFKWIKGKYFRFATPEEIALLKHTVSRLERKPADEPEELTPGFDDWVEDHEADIIPAVTEKPVADDGLTDFERMLRKMCRE